MTNSPTTPLSCTEKAGCPLGHTDYGLGHDPCGCYYDSGVYRNACPEHGQGSQGELVEAAGDLQKAINNPGVNPRYHHQLMARHRAEWPTLWAAIDLLARIEAAREAQQ